MNYRDAARIIENSMPQTKWCILSPTNEYSRDIPQRYMLAEIDVTSVANFMKRPGVSRAISNIEYKNGTMICFASEDLGKERFQGIVFDGVFICPMVSDEFVEFIKTRVFNKDCVGVLDELSGQL